MNDTLTGCPERQLEEPERETPISCFCAECEQPIYTGEYCYEFSDERTVCEDCWSDFVRKQYRVIAS